MQDDIQVPGELKDRVVKEAYKRIQLYEAEEVSAEKALTDIMTWLSELDEVEDTKAFSTTDLTVRFVDGSQIGILLGRRQAYGPSVDPREAKGGAPSKPDNDESVAR
jgi:hypothetical protein